MTFQSTPPPSLDEPDTDDAPPPDPDLERLLAEHAAELAPLSRDARAWLRLDRFVSAYPDGGTHDQVGKALGLSRQRIEQIERIALRSLAFALYASAEEPKPPDDFHARGRGSAAKRDEMRRADARVMAALADGPLAGDEIAEAVGVDVEDDTAHATLSRRLQRLADEGRIVRRGKRCGWTVYARAR